MTTNFDNKSHDCMTKMVTFWCDTLSGHFLVRLSCHVWQLFIGTCGATCPFDMSRKTVWTNQKLPRGMPVRNKCRTFFDAEQMPDISWCGTNAGHQWPKQKLPRGMLMRNKCRLVRNKCRTLVGVEQMPAISCCGTNA